MTAIQLAKFVLFVFSRGTANRAYSYKVWEKKIMFACLKATGELPRHIWRRGDDYDAVSKPRYSEDEVREFDSALDKFLSQNP